MIKRIETSKNNKIFRNISDDPNNPQNWMVIKKKRKRKKKKEVDQKQHSNLRIPALIHNKIPIISKIYAISKGGI